MNNKRIILSLYLLILLHSGYVQSDDNAIRAFWVVRHVLKSEKDIDKIVQTAYKSNISDIFVQIRALGQTYYPSRFETNSPLVNDQFDPLQQIITKCRLYNIRVHAWVNMFYIWSGDNLPKSEDHVLFKLKDHVLRNKDLPTYRDLRASGAEGYFLNPENLEVQNYLLNILCEIASTYDVSGIHLDYFRFPGLEYSFTTQSRTAFMLQNYYDPWFVYQDTEKYSLERGFEVYMQADKEYRTFLSTNLTNYLGKIYRTVKSIKTDIQLSVAVKPDPVIARHRYFQDWRTWLKENICDYIVLMNYRTDFQEFKSILDQLSDAELKNRIVVGISTYNQRAAAVQTRIDIVESEKFAGFSLFSYNHLLQNQSYLSSLRLIN